MDTLQRLYTRMVGQGPPPEADNQFLIEAIEKHIADERTIDAATVQKCRKTLEAVKTIIQCTDDIIIQPSTQTLRMAQTQQRIDDIMRGDHEQQTAEQRELERLRAKVKSMEERELISSKGTPPSVDEGYAYVKARSVGKPVDETYMAYCGSLAREYLTQRKQVPFRQEYAIINGIMDQHFANIRPQYDYDLHNVMRYNDHIAMVKRTTVRVFNRILTLPLTTMSLKSLNFFRPVRATDNTSLPYKPRSKLLWITLASILILIAGLCFIRPFSTPKTPTIMPSVPQQPLPPTKTDIEPSFFQSTILPILKESKSYVDSSVSFGRGVMSSISTLWTAPESEDFISKLSIPFEVDERSRLASLLSRSSKKWEQTNTNLHDLYKLVTQRSMSHMVYTSNHLKELTSASYNLAREHMTKSAPKYIGLARDIGTTLKETTRHLTRTLPPRCSEYVTNITSVVINKTTPYVNYVRKRLETELAPAAEKHIKYAAHVCQETLIPDTKLLNILGIKGDAIVNGDDFILFTDLPLDRDESRRILREFNMETEMGESQISIHRVEFCRCRLVYHPDGHPTMAFDPHRLQKIYGATYLPIPQKSYVDYLRAVQHANHTININSPTHCK